MLKYIAMFLMLTTPALANDVADDDSIIFKMGAGIKKISRSGLYIVGFEKSFDESYHYRLDFGTFSATGPEREGSYLASFLVGRQVGGDNGFRASLDLGIMAISQPDSLLSSAFQFTEELNIGYKDFDIGYKHISNAGITEPNIGRDYLTFSYRIRY